MGEMAVDPDELNQKQAAIMMGRTTGTGTGLDFTNIPGMSSSMGFAKSGEMALHMPKSEPIAQPAIDFSAIWSSKHPSYPAQTIMRKSKSANAKLAPLQPS